MGAVRLAGRGPEQGCREGRGQHLLGTRGGLCDARRGGQICLPPRAADPAGFRGVYSCCPDGRWWGAAGGPLHHRTPNQRPHQRIVGP